MVELRPERLTLSQLQMAFFALVVLGCPGMKPILADDDTVQEAPSADEQYWSFVPVRRSAVPITESGASSRSPLDVFINDRLAQHGVTVAAEASRMTLLRRVFLDLIGLPPPSSFALAFLSDENPDAYERCVDRLLASPHYGERWARPWMDLCHYADTDGYLTDQSRPVAWRYRDWLVGAMNADMPFDRFTIEQIAGDLLPDDNVEQHIATGFLRQTLSNREGGADLEEFRVKQIIDRTEMTGTIWLGLTVGCARCHDHKYEDISQREFFQLYAFFDNADEINIDAPLPGELEPYLQAKPEYDRKRSKLIAPIREELAELMGRWEARMLEAYHKPGQDAHWDRQWEILGLIWGGGLGEGQHEGIEILKQDVALRTHQQQDDLLDYFLKHHGHIDKARYGELKLGELREKLQDLKRELPRPTRAATMRVALTPRQTYIHERGEFRNHGPSISPGILDCLPPLMASSDPPRLQFARWLVAPSNPLTPRVTVNRWWQEFFGNGLVLTSDDFGKQGQLPTHPRLLDWLAADLVQFGWSRKQLHRAMVATATYRQSSYPRPDLAEMDPDNRLLARQSSLRVPAETVRDLTLSVSGQLTTKMVGPGVYPPQPARVTMEAFGLNEWPVSKAADAFRRGLYTYTIRTAPFAQAAIFDVPNPGGTCTRRDRSNTSLQALTLLNDEVFFGAAKALTARLFAEVPAGDDQRLNHAFLLCFSREPTIQEQQQAMMFLQRQVEILSDDPASVKMLLGDQDIAGNAVEITAWTSLSSVLMNLHEFITRD